MRLIAIIIVFLSPVLCDPVRSAVVEPIFESSFELICPTFYDDDDLDGFGDPLTGIQTCDTPPEGSVENGDDCDDSTDTIFPGATEICDGIDSDCGTGPGEPSNSVGFFDGVSWVDDTANWTGTSGSPALPSLATGHYLVCDGNYFVSINSNSPGDVQLDSLNGSVSTIFEGDSVVRTLTKSGLGLLTIDGFTFQNATAYVKGSNLFCENGGIEMNDLVIQGGFGSSGVGITVESSCSYANGNDVRILYNEADDEAGGLYVADGNTLSLNNSEIMGNSAGLGGGGLIFNSTLVLTNTTVSGNEASSGGGIALESSDGQSTLTCSGGRVDSNTGASGAGVHMRSGNNNITSNGCFWGAPAEADDNDGPDVSGLSNWDYEESEDWFVCLDNLCPDDYRTGSTVSTIVSSNFFWGVDFSNQPMSLSGASLSTFGTELHIPSGTLCNVDFYIWDTSSSNTLLWSSTRVFEGPFAGSLQAGEIELFLGNGNDYLLGFGHICTGNITLFYDEVGSSQSDVLYDSGAFGLIYNMLYFDTSYAGYSTSYQPTSASASSTIAPMQLFRLRP